MKCILENAELISKESALKLSINLEDNEYLVVYDSVKNVFLDDIELWYLCNNFQRLINSLDGVDAISVIHHRYKCIKYEFTDKFLAISCKYLNTVDKDGKCRYRNAKLFGKDASRLLFYDNYNVFCKSKYNKYINLPFSEDIDFLPVDKSFVLNNIETFRLCYDIKNEEKLGKFNKRPSDDVFQYVKSLIIDFK